jgi:Heterokaryon incompatibility protein (HET)
LHSWIQQRQGGIGTKLKYSDSSSSKMPYDPLDQSKNEIRLVRLKPVEYNHRQNIDLSIIVCELELTEHGENIQYSALSYAWNTGGLDRQIFIQNTPHNVSANLGDALLQLRDDKDDVVLWIDQLSINQSDDVEKSEQVLKMKDIYERAARVVVWLGAESDDSDVVMAMYMAFAKYIDVDADNLDKCESILSDIVAIISSGPLARPQYADWNESRVLDCLKTSFNAFCNRAYWKRLWVIQEYAVAREFDVACGAFSLPNNLFEDGWWFFETLPDRLWTMQFKDMLQPRNNLTNLMRACNSNAITFISGIINRRWIYQSTSSGKKTLQQVMMMNLGLQFDYNQPMTSDPRDRIFSLLGLASDAKDYPQFPDYSKNTKEIYEELARGFLRKKYVDMLAWIQFPRSPSLHDLPSWALDWSVQCRWSNTELQYANNIDTIGYVRRIDATGVYETEEQEVLFPDSKTAILRGTFIDSVQAIGEIWEPIWLECLDPKKASNYMANVREFCMRSSRISAEELDKSSAEIAVAGDIGPDIVNGASLAKKFFAEGRDLPLSSEFKYSNTLLSRNLVIASRYAEQLRTLHTRRVFISKTGYVGLAPTHVEVGDRLCLFLNSNAAFAIRHTPNNRYTLVGEAYVHGIMYGEFMATDPPIIPITLV